MNYGSKMADQQEKARLEAVESYQIEGTPSEEAFDELAWLAAQICQTPIALISIIGENRQWFKAHVGLDMQEAPREGSFCAAAISEPDVFVVQDAAADARFANLPIVNCEQGIRFYAGAPFRDAAGYAIGVLCVMDRRPRKLSAGKLQALRFLSRQVMGMLEHRRNLNRLAAQENFYHSLVESLAENIFRKDANERFTFANQRFCKMLGRQLEEIVGKTDFDFFPPEQAARYQQDDQEVMRTGRPLDKTELHITPDGRKLYVHVIKQPLTDAEGRVTGIQGIFWDETERVQTEEALAYERDLLNTLLENATEMVYFKDTQSRFLRCSKSMAKLFGYQKAEELVGKTDFDIHPQELATKFYGDEQWLFQTGRPILNELQQLVLAGGRKLFVIANKVPIFDANGKLRGLVGISADVSQLMEAQDARDRAREEYRRIFEEAIEGFFQTTPDGHYLQANPALARMYGYNSPKELIENLKDIAHQLYVEPGRRDEFIRLMREKGVVTNFESEIRRRDGSTIWISENARAVHDEQGNLLFFEGHVQDITDRKRAEAEKERAQQAIIEAAKLRSSILNNISHDLRGPINGIEPLARMFLEKAQTQEQREQAKTILESTRTLLQIVTDLLDYSRIEAGKLVIENVTYDLRDTVENIVTMMAEGAHRKNLELNAWFSPETPATVEGDVARLRQILCNLLGNAIKFTETGEVCVRVSPVEQDDKTTVVRFEVSDTGIGIAPEALPLIFRPFVQADSSTTRRYGGTGLGLSICKQLVELMHGKIGVDSVLGKGTTFWFTLPLKPATSATIQDKSLQYTPALEGKRVMLVDDNATTRQILSEFLASHNMVVSQAESAAAALELLRTHTGRHFDFLILDNVMPEISGLDLARIIARDRLAEGARVIIAKHSGQEIGPEAQTEANVHGSLFKPIKQNKLLECLVGLSTGPGPEQASAHPSGKTDMALDRNLRILVVEDMTLNQKVAQLLLKDLGFEPDLAASGVEALAKLEKAPYDILLLDCHMPEMDGFQTAKEISRRLKDSTAGPPLKSAPYIIALTANATPGAREKCLSAGMHDYLTKPLSKADLREALRAAVTNRRANYSINAAADSSKPLDQEIIERFRSLRKPGQPDPLAELVELFLQEVPKQLQSLHNALDKKDAAAIKKTAHILCGNSRNMGAFHLGKLCAELEQSAASGKLDNARDMVGKIMAEFERVKTALEQEIKK